MMSEIDQDLVTAIQRSYYVAAAVVLAAAWTIEAIAPMFVGRQHRASHIATNFGLAAINAVVSYAFAFAILFVTEWAGRNGFGLLNVLSLPAWAQWIAALLLFDCWQYWWHRINHRVPLFWRFHAVHHADAELDASSGVRFHTGEIVLSFLARLAVVPLIGLTISQLLLYEAFSLPIILFHHSNIRITDRVDRWVRWLIVTPRMHYVHHSRWRPETDSNYASFLSIWDRLFRSFRLRERPEEISLGLDHWEDREWRRLPGMLAAPFRTVARGRNQTNAPGVNHSASSPVLLAMLKAPRVGYVKTRLARDIGADAAAVIFRALVERQMAAIPVSWRSEVHVAPADATSEMQRWLGPRHTYHPQSRGDLGERLISAIAGAFERGASAVIVVGGDCPDLDQTCLNEAASLLRQVDVVLGPALDGGYYLIGLTRPTPQLFMNIPWSSSQVLEATVERIKTAGLKQAMLAPKEDIDDLASLRRVFPSASETRHYLSQLAAHPPGASSA
jgi:rSAM/selenodomain-associated transferase 1